MEGKSDKVRIATSRHDLSVRMAPIKEIQPWSKNPRDNDQAAERLAYTIQAHGWTNPILLDKSGQIVAGHTRYKAAIRLGLSEVPVIDLDVEGSEAVAIAIADNRVGEVANWDADALSNALRMIREDEEDLDALGFDDGEIALLLQDLDDVPFSDEMGMDDLSEESHLMIVRVSVAKSEKHRIDSAVEAARKGGADGGSAEILGAILLIAIASNE